MRYILIFVFALLASQANSAGMDDTQTAYSDAIDKTACVSLKYLLKYTYRNCYKADYDRIDFENEKKTTLQLIPEFGGKFQKEENELKDALRDVLELKKIDKLPEDADAWRKRGRANLARANKRILATAGAKAKNIGVLKAQLKAIEKRFLSQISKNAPSNETTNKTEDKNSGKNNPEDSTTENDTINEASNALEEADIHAEFASAKNPAPPVDSEGYGIWLWALTALTVGAGAIGGYAYVTLKKEHERNRAHIDNLNRALSALNEPFEAQAVRSNKPKNL